MKLLFGASNSGNAQAFTQQLIDMSNNGNSVIIGAKKSARHTNMPASRLMALLEYGSAEHKIPASPVIAITASKNRKKYSRLYKGMVKASTSQARHRQALVAVGKAGAADLVTTIRTITSPRNTAATAAAKGFNKRYVRTGLIQRQIGYQITTNSDATAASKSTQGKLRKIMYAYTKLTTSEFFK